METLLEAAVRATLLAAGVLLLVRLAGIRSPRLMHRAWAAVAMVMLLQLPLAVGGVRLPVAILTPPPPASPLFPAIVDTAPLAATTSVVPAPAVPSPVTWMDGVAAIYFGGVLLLLVRLAAGMHRGHQLRRQAVEIGGRLTHPACVTPMTIGLLAPAVVLPRDYPAWDAADLGAVLAHEEEHARRRDPLVTALALLARAVFWFHPLAWWLQRHIAALAEQACDEVVLSQGHDAHGYSQSLLRFARLTASARGRITPLVTTMPGSGLGTRLARLGQPRATAPSALRQAIATIAFSVLAAVCSAASPVPQAVGSAAYATWTTSTSEHFEIVHTGVGADELTTTARDAEAAFARLREALAYEPTSRLLVVLVPRDTDMASGPPPELVAPRRQRIVLSRESLRRRPSLIAHELTHAFAFEIVPGTSRVAPFLIEGLAGYMSGAWLPQDLKRTRDAALTGAVPALESLSTTDQHWAHALFDFVGAEYGDDGVRRLLFGLRAHETLGGAVPMAFGLSGSQFDQAFRRHITARFGQ